MVKQKGLGRGLDALLANDIEDARNTDLQQMLNVSQLQPGKYQPRSYMDDAALQTLADSIKTQGIMQPILVREVSPDKFEIIAGERRWRASQMAGLEQVPVLVREIADESALAMALIENIQRENLNAIEIALSYQRLISECSLKQDELGERVGKNRATVTNYLRLLKLPPDVQIAVRDNKISMGHARAIINVENPDQQLYIFKKTLTEDLSVRKVEELVRNLSTFSEVEKTVQPPSSAVNREIAQLQSQLSSHFGTRIVIKSDGKKGEIKIPFLSVEDLNRILDILKLH